MQSNKIDLKGILISFTIIYSIMPYVSRMTSRYLTTYTYMLLTVFLVVFIIFRNPHSTNHYFGYLLPALAFKMLTIVTKDSSLLLWGYQVFLFLLPLVLGYHVVLEDQANNNIYSTVLQSCIVITMLTTAVGCFRNPEAARYLASVATSNDALGIYYGLRNIAGYEFVYTVVLLYPLLIYAFKRRVIKRPVFIVSAIACIAFVISCEYTIALLLFLTTSALVFLKRDLRVKDVVVFGVLSIIVVFVFRDILSVALEFLSSRIQSDDMSERLHAMAGGGAGLESIDDDRIDRYLKSLRTFLSHPLVGTFLKGGYGHGGHSGILDNLAKYGALGGFLMYHMYKRVYMALFKPFKDTKAYGYYIWCFIQGIILSIINTGLWFSVLAFYAPLLFLQINKKAESIYENSLDRQ